MDGFSSTSDTTCSVEDQKMMKDKLIDGKELDLKVNYLRRLKMVVVNLMII